MCRRVCYRKEDVGGYPTSDSNPQDGSIILRFLYKTIYRIIIHLYTADIYNIFKDIFIVEILQILSTVNVYDDNTLLSS